MDFITIVVLFFSPPSPFPVFSHVVPSHPKRNNTPSIPLLVHSRCYQESNDSSGGQWSDTRRRIIVTPGFYAEAIFVLITALSVESKRGEEERIKKALMVCRKGECVCVCVRVRGKDVVRETKREWWCTEWGYSEFSAVSSVFRTLKCCFLCCQDFSPLIPSVTLILSCWLYKSLHFALSKVHPIRSLSGWFITGLQLEHWYDSESC